MVDAEKDRNYRVQFLNRFIKRNHFKCKVNIEPTFHGLIYRNTTARIVPISGCMSVSLNGGIFAVYRNIRKHEYEGAKIFDMKSAYRIF
jgi:hypothetical protein